MSSLIEGPALKVEDITDRADKYLTEKTKLAISDRYALDLEKSKNGVVTHRCVQLGRRVKLSDLETGIKVLAEKVDQVNEVVYNRKD